MKLHTGHLHGDVYQILDHGYKVVGGAYSETLANQFAAAPDLLSLVERAVADRIDDTWLKDARKVLAKATGEKTNDARNE